MSEYENFFVDQLGCGSNSVADPSYVCINRRYQQGAGIGSYLGGLYRRALPMIKRGAKSVGKEAIRAGAHILDDVVNEKQPLKEAFRRRMRESGGNLKRKATEVLDKMVVMDGSGYKKRQKRQNAHSRAVSQAVSIGQEKKKLSPGLSSGCDRASKTIRKVRDIFEK